MLGRGFNTHEWVGASMGTWGLELRTKGQQPALYICQVLLRRDLWTVGFLPAGPYRGGVLGWQGLAVAC